MRFAIAARQRNGAANSAAFLISNAGRMRYSVFFLTAFDLTEPFGAKRNEKRFLGHSPPHVQMLRAGGSHAAHRQLMMPRLTR